MGWKGSGSRSAISAPTSGAAPAKSQTARVAGGVEEQLADQRPDAQPGPDRQPVEADHPAAPLGRGDVDDPGRAGGEDRALAGAEDQAGADQAGDPERQQVEEAGDGDEDRAEQHGRLAAAAVGEATGERAQEQAGDRV